MGFSVTAAHIIFSIALLGALSAASTTYWKNQSAIEGAQRIANERLIKEAHANLSLSGAMWNGGALTETFMLTNSGTVGFDDSLFHYMFDGNVTFQGQAAGYPKLNGVSPPGSVLLLPGETFECRFELAQEPAAIMIVTDVGSVYAHYP